VQGMRSKKEFVEFGKALKAWNTKILYISENISAKAMFYVEQYCLSHSMQLADALIGATATTYSFPIMTGNNKHYKMLKGLQVKLFRP
ncbi:MAG: VapC toxin family PIN domain ribonuclease, partial [Deltaproteobacteria bacterium]